MLQLLVKLLLFLLLHEANNADTYSNNVIVVGLSQYSKTTKTNKKTVAYSLLQVVNTIMNVI